MISNPASTGRRTQSAVQGTVAMCFVRSALESVRSKDLDIDGILRHAGLSVSRLTTPDQRVTAQEYGALWRAIALALDDELFGQDSRRMKAGTFAMVCHSALGCATLHDAMQRIVRFFQLVLDDLTIRLDVGSDDATIELVPRRLPSKVFGQECLLMLIHGLVTWLVGRAIPIKRASFSYSEPPHSAEYALLYSPVLQFEAASTTISVDVTCLALEVVQNRSSLKEFLRKAPEGIFLKPEIPVGIAARVHATLKQLLGNRATDLKNLATLLGVSSATLRRQLHAEGTSYREIKHQVRLELATTYLNDSARSAADIAWDLGYSERSVFDRAFRGWTNESPGHFRRRRSKSDVTVKKA